MSVAVQADGIAYRPARKYSGTSNTRENSPLACSTSSCSESFFTEEKANAPMKRLLSVLCRTFGLTTWMCATRMGL